MPRASPLLVLFALLATSWMVPPASANEGTVLYREDLSDGAAQGWSLTGLWHVSSTCDGRSDLGFHRAGRCDMYGTSTQYYHGNASVTFSLPALDRIVLNFSERVGIVDAYICTPEEPEPCEDSYGFQALSVEARRPGGAWTRLSVAGSQCGYGSSWHTCSANLTGFANGTVDVRFRTEGVSERQSDRSGWYLDEFLLTGWTLGPIANAGADSARSDADGDGVESVTLDGRASRATTRPIASYRWTLGDAILAEMAYAQVALPPGEHVVTLRVTDDAGRIAVDTVVHRVLPNAAPVADAGADRRVAKGAGLANVTLDGRASVDPDGAIVSWTWREDGALVSNEPAVALALDLGVRSFALTVVDHGGASATDVVTIEVAPNQAPRVDAGADRALRAPATFTIAGFATDADGVIVAHRWTSDGETIATTPNVTLTRGAGTYRFQLHAEDDLGGVGTDEVVVTVAPNAPPVAAGAARCYALRCELDASLSRDDDGSVASVAWRVEDATLEGRVVRHTFASYGAHVARLEVTDNDGASATADVVVEVAPQPEPTRPTQAPARIHVVDNLRDAGDVAGGSQDVRRAWLAASPSTVYVAIEAAGDAAPGPGLVARHVLVARPSWLAAGDRVEVHAIVGGVAPRYELREVVGGVHRVHVVDGTTADALHWIAIPRALLREPAGAATLEQPRLRTLVQPVSTSGLLPATGAVVDETNVGASFALPGLDAPARAEHTFAAGDEGWRHLRDAPRSDARWTNQRIEVTADRQDVGDEIHAQGLPAQWTSEGPSFRVDARWQLLAPGAHQSLHPLFLGPADVMDVATGRSVLHVDYDGGGAGATPRYTLRYVDGSGALRAAVEVSTAATDLRVEMSYDAPTRTLRATLVTPAGAPAASLAYVVGTAPGDGFAFDVVGIAADNGGGAAGAVARGAIDDVRFSWS